MATNLPSSSGRSAGRTCRSKMSPPRRASSSRVRLVVGTVDSPVGRMGSVILSHTATSRGTILRRRSTPAVFSRRPRSDRQNQPNSILLPLVADKKLSAVRNRLELRRQLLAFNQLRLVPVHDRDEFIVFDGAESPLDVGLT